MSAEVAAATLFLHCEDRLKPSYFEGMSEEHLRSIGNLSHLTKVSFVLHWLDGARRQPSHSERAQAILTPFQIIFNPDLCENERSEETEQIAGYLARLATNAFGLVDFAANHPPNDPAYFTYLNEWSRKWLISVDDSEATAKSISDDFALPLTAILLAELTDLRQILTESMQTA